MFGKEFFLFATNCISYFVQFCCTALLIPVRSELCRNIGQADAKTRCLKFTAKGAIVMAINIETDDGVVEVYLTGEIDHHSAGELRDEIDAAIGRISPTKVILDFRGVTFMDSSGIGLVMGRYKLIEGTGCTLELRGLSSPIKRVMRLAGLDRIAVMDGGTKK